MAPRTPLLDLTTEVPQVRIDGEQYDLRTRDDLSIVRDTETQRQWLRVDELRRKSNITKGETAEMSRHLSAMCATMLDAPDAVQKRLSLAQKMNVVTAFFQQVAENAKTTRTATDSDSTAVGGKKRKSTSKN